MMRTFGTSRSFFAVAVAVVAMMLPAYAAGLPHWNVTLPANPGTSTQRVSITAGVLSTDRVFPQNTVHIAFPLKDVTSITQPYLYQKNWLIDLKLRKKTMMVSKLNVGMVDRTPSDEVSLFFLNRADAAAARAYLLAQLH
jgi:hypothetical protein